jgi:uncharacterized protein
VRVFLDSALVIYLVDQNPIFGPRTETWLKAHPGDLVSSELMRMESLVLPVRNNDPVRIAEFENYFNSRIAEMVPFLRSVFDQAIEIRARFPFKIPDALHLAAAVESKCDVFLTNDHQLRQFTGITVEVI